MQDGVGVGDWRQLLLAHPPQAHGRERRAAERQHPDNPPVAEVPAHRAVVEPQGAVEAQTGQEGIRPESRKPLVQRPVVHRQHEYRHAVRDQQHRGHSHGLVVEEFSRQAVEEDQRDEHRAGRQHRAEHRPADLLRPLHDGIPEGLSPLPTCRDVVRQHDGIVHHHAHAQQQAGQGDNIDGQADGIENKERDDERDRNRERDQQRRAQVLHEKENHHDVQQDRQQDIDQQIADRIVQQLRLVAGHGEFHLGIVRPEVLQLLRDAFFERSHPRLALLDHGQRDGIPSIAAR